ELAVECERRGLGGYAALIGSALPARPGAPSAQGVEYHP
ncbi:MAG: hypothetical protein QOF49_518, partial [Chloroflexota bacterium]|nr:hypothetical protein [Chloroflexota bacterium]